MPGAERRDQRDELINVQLQANGTHRVVLPEHLNPGLSLRVRACGGFIERAVQRFRKLGHNTVQFNIQLHDDEPNKSCFLIDAAADQDPDKLPMIPDFYCLRSGGYATLRKSFEGLPPWNEKIPIAIWRGSTKGAEQLNKESIQTLQRYKLCRFSLNHPGWLDARFNAVVQAKSNEANENIMNHLHHVDLLRPRMEPAHMGLHRWIVDIDGNVNSWGLLWKFLSGSCVLRVESPRQQWFHRHLSPWQTHIPIAADLHDLPEKLEWCRSHPLSCADIAHRGQQTATNVINTLDSDQDQAIDIYAKQNL